VPEEIVSGVSYIFGTFFLWYYLSAYVGCSYSTE